MFSSLTLALNSFLVSPEPWLLNTTLMASMVATFASFGSSSEELYIAYNFRQY